MPAGLAAIEESACVCFGSDLAGAHRRDSFATGQVDK